ncbi:CLUMA_CG010953, isoform A [Clunio marinus]|uniref:CLUMA_CG010953, isoform A n=1 Tax=Clunio marinus TaxID=568069 RepID=A0A1J1IB97_9DIPT|nr:CLUMA_CG010953, isoform A [Clunio marinus]
MSDLLKIFLMIQLFGFCFTMPVSEESYDSAYDQELAGWIPVINKAGITGYYPISASLVNRIHPSYNERIKTWQVVPSKRNSELINSLLGLPKNMDAAGK